MSERMISTHAPRTGSDEYFITYGRTWEISTHAPRTGSDVQEGVKQIREM